MATENCPAQDSSRVEASRIAELLGSICAAPFPIHTVGESDSPLCEALISQQGVGLVSSEMSAV